MTAFVLAALVGLMAGSGAPGSMLDGRDNYATSAGFLEDRAAPGPLIAYPGWLPDFDAERSSPSMLPSWISGIIDSPLFHTPMRVRISRSGFLLGWRFGFDL